MYWRFIPAKKLGEREGAGRDSQFVVRGLQLQALYKKLWRCWSTSLSIVCCKRCIFLTSISNKFIGFFITFCLLLWYQGNWFVPVCISSESLCLGRIISQTQGFMVKPGFVHIVSQFRFRTLNHASWFLTYTNVDWILFLFWDLWKCLFCILAERVPFSCFLYTLSLNPR